MKDCSPEAFRLAPSGEGPHAYNWADKPHRVLYDAARRIEELTSECSFTKARLWLMVEAFAEIKATVDGKSEQSIKDIVYGLLDEITNAKGPVL